jgi:TonB family protein
MISSLVLALAVSATASPSAQPAQCANPNREVTVVKAVAPVYPESAPNLGPVTVLLDVKIKPDGTLLSAGVQQSSNNMTLDQAALRAARNSQYSPKYINCKAVAGDYVFRADFAPR